MTEQIDDVELNREEGVVHFVCLASLMLQPYEEKLD